MNQADTLELLRKMRMDLTQLQARLTDVIESVAGFPLPQGAGDYQSPAKICTDCGEKLGHGHADDCPRLPAIDEAA